MERFHEHIEKIILSHGIVVDREKVERAF